ncbi:DNA-binding GntR family transcriptional regulator [Agrobacterium larrymoorei]|uniref:DNA-binding GntR family transcriptional regulator n=1 Tax=Agrobacterium larrymoorei TaxID=160699 RepID=A0AAJ2EUN1_9HYPH|nr:GntR family transcriptional regulator [Agrobacterium larrymoorei]MDR6101607.1 DNA-binding GntR family transcriptional regulator [Agrobacterium larrymoorei]
MNTRLRQSDFLPGDGVGQPKALMAYNHLRHAIITMKMEPGATISEKETCAELGISRTPMREAVLRLAQEGLVNVVPSGGTFVNTISLRGVIEGHLIRSSLELRMARIAAHSYNAVYDRDFDLLVFLQNDASKRQDYDQSFAVDNNFHRLVCTMAGFPDIWQAIHNATGQLDRIRRYAIPRSGYFDEVEQEHQAIYQAIKSGDADGAYNLMRRHLDDIAAVVEYVFADQPNLIAQEPGFDVSTLNLMLAPPATQ